MNSLERMSLALKREQPDRVPIITFTNIGKRNLSNPLTDYILENADAQYEFQVDEFSYLSFPGIGIKLSRSDTSDADGWIERKYAAGNGTEFSEIFTYAEQGLYRSYKQHIIRNIRDLDLILDLPYIVPQDNAGFKEQIDNFHRDAIKHTGGNEFCVMIINNPLSFICANTDPQDIAIWTITEREAIRRYLGEMLKRNLDYLEHMLKKHDYPAVFMIGGAEFAIPPLMSPRDFDEFVLQYDKPIIALIHRYNKRAIVHCHGKVCDFLSRFIEMGADGIHPLEPVGATGDCDLNTVKQRYGRRICLIGNIQYEDFAEMTPPQMKSRVKQLMDAAKAGGGFILSPACGLFHSRMPEKIEANIRAYVDAGLEYGRY